MKLSNKEVVEICNGLSSALQGVDQPLPAEISYAIVHNKRKLQEVLKDYEDCRMEYVQRVGEYSAADQGYKIPPDKVQEVSAWLQNLENEVNEIDIRTIEFSKLAALNFTVAAMDALYFMIVVGQI